MKLLLLLIISNVLALGFCDSGPIVEAPAGKFEGHILKTRNGRDILSFEGIPYAKPPVGELRLKDPVPIGKLDGIYNATDGTRQCYQPVLNMSLFTNLSHYMGGEDCLYLNVHKPAVGNDTAPLPVMFWIHGGGFFLGSGSLFWNSPEFLLDKDIIFVTTNYRLSILGFLFDSENDIAGNFGMKDQIMALKWVQDNIAAFGGDPNMVTIAGESAGGGAVSLLMHSPLAKGLFNKVIAQSGTIYSSFSLHPEEVAVNVFTKAVVDDLGCSRTKNSLLKCLQKMPLNELFKSALALVPEEQLFSMDFIPVLEKPSPSAFMTEESFNEPSTLPLMVGVTSSETMYMLDALVGKSKKYNGDVTKMKADLDILMPIWGAYTCLRDKQNITDKLAQYYYGDGGKTNATYVTMTHYMSDVMFNYGAHKAAKVEKGPVYLYKFSYQGDHVGPYKPPKGLEDGVSHGEELRYLLKTFVQPTDTWSEKDLAMSKTMVDLWYNFAKHGDPTPESKTWEESANGVKYLDIERDGLVMKTNMFQERMQFLEKVNIDRFKNLAY